MVQRSRVAERVRGTVEAAIVELSAERDKIDAELMQLVAMLAPFTKPPRKKGKRQVNKKPPKKNVPGRIPKLALSMMAGGQEITAPMLAKHAKTPPSYASTILNELAAAGQCVRVKRGVYGRKP